jgi:hypothetical protein
MKSDVFWDALTEVTMKVNIAWNVMPYSVLQVC